MKLARWIAAGGLAAGLLLAWTPIAEADQESCQRSVNKAQEKLLTGIAKIKAKETKSVLPGKKPMTPEEVAERIGRERQKAQARVQAGCAGVAPTDVDPFLCPGLSFEECVNEYSTEVEALVEDLASTLLPEGGLCVDNPTCEKDAMPLCNVQSQCFCNGTTEGTVACIDAIDCATAQPCTSSSECPLNQACYVNTCCDPGGGVCGPIDCQRGSGSNVIGTHKCTLDTDPSTFELNLVFQSFVIPASVSGGIDLSCGAIDPNTGTAPCSCTIQSLTPFELPNIGFICLTPGGVCPAGEIDCDGGNALAWETVANHNIGACTGNADCNGQCATYCSGLGGGYVAKADQGDACEGFCSGGVNDDDPCTLDADCLPGGACSGQDPPLGPHDPNNPNICGCQCLRMPAGASSPGDLKCQLPTGINVEALAPCDGTDITIAVGNVCIPLSTQSSDNALLTANNGTGMISPATLTGTGGNCLDLETSITGGIELVGQVDFFDTTIGDVKSQTRFTCQ